MPAMPSEYAFYGYADEKMAIYEFDEKPVEGTIERLEVCPCCEYAMFVPANLSEVTLNCDNCGVISCRRCKKNHPNSFCKDMERGEHKIEEAMTRAIIRYCPGCNVAFIKEEGNNDIACQNCDIQSCYVCQKQYKDRSKHFKEFSRPKWWWFFVRRTRCPLLEEGRATKSVKVIHKHRVMQTEEKMRKRLPKAHRFLTRTG